MNNSSVLSFLLICLTFLGCESFKNEQYPITELNEAREKWREVLENSTRSYQFSYHKICFCSFTEEVIIAVQADSITSVSEVGSNELMYIEINGEQQYVLDIMPDQFNTVEELFAIIEHAKDANKLSVEFDAQFGYPTSINIDYAAAIADDEVSYRLSNLSFSSN